MEKKFRRHTVKITNPGKVLFPDNNITKIELVNYYECIAPIILPHVKNRALTMHRFPNGIAQKGFYHKNIPDYFPSWIDTIAVKKSDGGSTTYAIVNNMATLAYLANYVCITPHVWLSRTEKLNYPDIMVFDLDPGNQNFSFVCTVAKRLKKILIKNNLIPFVKTSGSKGLHVTVPLDKKSNFEKTRGFARYFAQKLAEQDPKNITLEASLKKRQGRLFIDVARNAFAQTVVAPYAVRALPGAPIATPVEWRELSNLVSSQHYTIKNIFRRLGHKKDPWEKIYTYSCSL